MAITDSIMVPRFLLITALTTIIAIFVWFSFQDTMSIIVSDRPGNSTIVQTMNELRTSYISIDYMWPLMVGGLLIISLIFAYKTGASVIYAFLSLIFWGFAMLMSSVFSNVFEVFRETFPTVITEVPIMDWTFLNLKWIVLVWVFLISIVMFTRTSTEEEQLNTKVFDAQEKYYG